MKIKFNNMLEVMNAISAIEKRLEFDEKYTGKDISFVATLNVYNQFRPVYDGYYPWKYDKDGNRIEVER